MDQLHFDALARTVAAKQPRRSMARVGLALGIGLLGATVREPRPSEAKKRTKKKKKKVKGCTRNCNGKACGDDGCQGSCGSCPAGQVCTAGSCEPDGGACGAPCTGGQVCNSTTGQCECPRDTPRFCDGQCRACCTDNDCGQFTARTCRHDLGSICVCWDNNHDCGQGICWTCCTDGHCAAIGRDPGNGFYCKQSTHACVCQDGLSECPNADQSGYYCADTSSDERNCGSCGFNCTAGGASAHCERGFCVRNE